MKTTVARAARRPDNYPMTTQRLASGALTWYNITDPTIHDIAGLRRAFPAFSELHLEDALSRIERPKRAVEESYVFLVLIFPLWDARTRMTRGSEVDVFITREAVVTVHDGVLKPLLRAALEAGDEAGRTALLAGGAARLFHTLLDRLVDYIFPILRKIDSNIRNVEETIFERHKERDLIREISLLRRDAFAVRRILHQLLPVLHALDHHRSGIVSDGLDDYFDDLLDHARRAHDMIDEDVEVITALADTADTLLTHRLNSVIRILTVISTIMLPLSIVVGAFGMNVALPFESDPNAFAIIVLLMLAISVGMLAYFRTRNWL